MNELGRRKTGGMTLAWKNVGTRKQTSTSFNLGSTDSTRSGLGMIAYLAGDGPATYRPKHDMVTAFSLPFPVVLPCKCWQSTTIDSRRTPPPSSIHVHHSLISPLFQVVLNTRKFSPYRLNPVII